MADIMRRVAKISSVPVRPLLLDGRRISESLCKTANAEADLVVMATRGRSPIGRLLWGSVADTLLQETSVPLLLVGGYRSSVDLTGAPLDPAQTGMIAVNTTRTFRTRINLSDESREQLIAALNQQLVDTFDLYSQTKQAHWNVKGAQFIALHELFDTLAAELQAYVDLIGERATALGGLALGTARMAAETLVCQSARWRSPTAWPPSTRVPYGTPHSPLAHAVRLRSPRVSTMQKPRTCLRKCLAGWTRAIGFWWRTCNRRRLMRRTATSQPIQGAARYWLRVRDLHLSARCRRVG